MLKNILSQIPFGSYCYTHTDNGYKTCPFHEVVETVPQNTNAYNYKRLIKQGFSDDEILSMRTVVRARCNLIDLEDEFPQDLTLLWDECKACGINDDTYQNQHQRIYETYKPFSLLMSGTAC